MAWSEDDVIESGSITVEGEVAPPAPVEIDDEEAQLEVDDAEHGDIEAVWIKNFINTGIFQLSSRAPRLRISKRRRLSLINATCA